MQTVPNTAIAPINLANDYFLANEMSALEHSVLAAAQNTVNEFTRGAGVTLADAEMEAVVTVQVLKELNSVDLSKHRKFNAADWEVYVAELKVAFEQPV